MDYLTDGSEYEVESIPEQLPVLYADEHLVAVYKPAGLLVHRSPIDGEKSRFAMQIVRDQLGHYVYPVHRLDKPTSGVLLLARSSSVASLMMPMFASGQVNKHYEAIVRGFICQRQVLDYALKNEDNPQAEPKSAITEYWPERFAELPVATGRYPSSRYSWLKICPKTGRRHQIRRHMHHISHPIIGDTTHGDGRHNRLFRSQEWPGLWLLAKKLMFTHPVNQRDVVIELDYPQRWMSVQQELFERYPVIM